MRKKMTFKKRKKKCKKLLLLARQTWIRIGFVVKCCIRIRTRTENNAGPKHCPSTGSDSEDRKLTESNSILQQAPQYQPVNEKLSLEGGKSIKLKVVCNENQGGSGRWHTFGIGIGSWRSMFFWLLIFAVVFILMYFHFR
jgi:hypothetical protein